MIQMQREEAFKKIVTILVDQLGKDANIINENTSFVLDLEADSLDLLQLVTAIEDVFEICIPDEDFERIQTVGQALDEVLKIVESK
jgi:acyl carrier protein